MGRAKRVSPEKIRENAKQGDRGPSWLNLPEGVSEFTPEKAGKYSFDFLPYKVTVDVNPDGIEKGTVWYKRQFLVHHGVGSGNKSVVCPTSIGKKCPISRARSTSS